MTRTLVAATLVAMLSASVHAADPAPSQDPAVPLDAQRLELRALFEAAPGVEVDGETGMIISGPIAVDVIVARIDTDGKLVKACVNSEEAARRFLEAPIEKIDGRKAKEH